MRNLFKPSVEEIAAKKETDESLGRVHTVLKGLLADQQAFKERSQLGSFADPTFIQNATYLAISAAASLAGEQIYTLNRLESSSRRLERLTRWLKILTFILVTLTVVLTVATFLFVSQPN